MADDDLWILRDIDEYPSLKILCPGIDEEVVVWNSKAVKLKCGGKESIVNRFFVRSDKPLKRIVIPKLLPHPNIIHFDILEQDDASNFIGIRENYPTTLYYYKVQNPLSKKDKIVMYQIANSVAYMASNNITHNNIRSSIVFLDDAPIPRVVLGNFGSAKIGGFFKDDVQSIGDLFFSMTRYEHFLDYEKERLEDLLEKISGENTDAFSILKHPFFNDVRGDVDGCYRASGIEISKGIQLPQMQPYPNLHLTKNLKWRDRTVAETLYLSHKRKSDYGLYFSVIELFDKLMNDNKIVTDPGELMAGCDLLYSSLRGGDRINRFGGERELGSILRASKFKVNFATLFDLLEYILKDMGYDENIKKSAIHLLGLTSLDGILYHAGITQPEPFIKAILELVTNSQTPSPRSDIQHLKSEILKTKRRVEVYKNLKVYIFCKNYGYGCPWSKILNRYYIFARDAGKIAVSKEYIGRAKGDLNRIPEKQFDIYLKNKTPLDFSYFTDKEYGDDDELFERDENRIFMFTYDIFQTVCRPVELEDYERGISLRNEMTQNKLLGLLRRLEKYARVVPPVDFLFDVGGKLYVRHMKKFMTQPTLVYPDDEEEIKSLDENEFFILKPGLSSGNRGIIENVRGKDVFSTIEDEVLPPFRRFGTRTKSNKDSECGDVIVIVQRQLSMFKRCFEYRFFVVNNKIIGLTVGQLRWNKWETNVLKLGLNTRVYKFVHKIMNHLTEFYGCYLFARIDIIVECGKNEKEEVKREVIDDPFNFDHLFQSHTPRFTTKKAGKDVIFNPNFKGEIFLNEIEPLGSGWKGDINLAIDDDGEKGEVSHVFNTSDEIPRNFVHEKIIEGFVENLGGCANQK